MRFHLGLAITLLATGASGAAEYPCASVQGEIRDLASASGDLSPRLLQCTRTSRVCVITFPDVGVLGAESVRDLPIENASSFGVVQSAPGDRPALCLVGTYSGGSAAAWSFQGWKVEGGRGIPIEGMQRARLNNDSVPPRTLGNAIFGAYARSRK
jgi:hypothetical protein